MTDYTTETMLRQMFSHLELKVNEKQIITMNNYIQLLVEELQKQRLVGEKKTENIINKQIYDSLYLLKKVSLKRNSKMLDLGTGGGLPGIPIKIIRQDINIYLMDSIKKKTAFLREAIKCLSLNNAFVLEGRAEEYAHLKKHRQAYDYVCSKAVAEINILAELTLPFIKIGGKAIYYKGPKGNREIETAAEAIELCGGKVNKSIEYKLPAGERRVLFITDKNKETPDGYPRAAGKPQKKPLGN